MKWPCEIDIAAHTRLATCCSLPRQFVRNASQPIDFGSAVESSVLGVDQSERHRRQKAQSIGDVEHAQDTKEVRPLHMGYRRIDDHHLLYRRLEQGGIGGHDAKLPSSDHAIWQLALGAI